MDSDNQMDLKWRFGGEVAGAPRNFNGSPKPLKCDFKLRTTTTKRGEFQFI